MYILIPLILSVICSFVNSHVGLFGIFTVVELIIIFCIDINASVRIKLSFKLSGQNAQRAERLKKTGTALATAECILTVFFTIVTIIVESGVWIIASGYLTGDIMVMMPFSIVPKNNLTFSFILLIASVVFQIIALILSFIRRTQLKKRTKEHILDGKIVYKQGQG